MTKSRPHPRGHTHFVRKGLLSALTYYSRRTMAYSELRKKMGNAGQARARELYDWKRIIRTYEELWAELSEIRLEGRKNSTDSSRSVWGARLDPTIAFANYPTSHLTPETMLRLVAENTYEARSQIDDLKRLMMVNYANYMFPRDPEIEIVLNNASKEFQTAENLLSGIEQSRRA